MIKLALLGWGKEAPAYYDLIQNQIKSVQLSGISSGDEEILQQIRSSSEIKLVERDYKRLLGFHDIDGVIISAGYDRSLNMVIDAFEAGKHVMMCNPIATNVSEALTIKAKADQYSTQYASVALQRQYDSNLIAVKSLLKKGAIGEVSSYRSNAIIAHQEPNAKHSKNVRAGLYMDSMIEDIDMIHFLTDDVFADVHAKGCIRRFFDLEKLKDIDTAMVNAKMRSGIHVQMQALVSKIEGPAFELEIEGSEGRISCTDAIWSRDIHLRSNTGLRIIKSEFNQSPRRLIIEQFAEAIARKKEPLDTVQEGIQNIKTAVAMSKSDILKEEVEV